MGRAKRSIVVGRGQFSSGMLVGIWLGLHWVLFYFFYLTFKVQVCIGIILFFDHYADMHSSKFRYGFFSNHVTD